MFIFYDMFRISAAAYSQIDGLRNQSRTNLSYAIETRTVIIINLSRLLGVEISSHPTLLPWKTCDLYIGLYNLMFFLFFSCLTSIF
jgi:hypothetical protein